MIMINKLAKAVVPALASIVAAQGIGSWQVAEPEQPRRFEIR